MILAILTKVSLVFICMLAHELGHIVVARYYKIPVRKIGINWMGMYIQRARSKGWAEIATCLAGCAVNLALAVMFWNGRMPGMSYYFALCNAVCSVVNLLPIPHSDGKHAWEALVERVRVAG